MRGRVLVIDNDHNQVDSLAALLDVLGYETLRAHDGEAGLHLFHEELPDLVILDLMLPRLDGSTVCAEIKKSAYGLFTPIVVVTGARGQSKLDVMKATGALDVVAKPFQSEKIVTLMEWIFSGDREDSSLVEDAWLDQLAIDPPGSDTQALSELPQVLEQVVRDQFTGMLVASKGRTRKLLDLEGGLIRGAHSNVRAERIDRVLLSMRRVTPAQLGQLRREFPDDAPGLLDVLAARGMLDEAARQQVLAYQAMTIGMSLFRAAGQLQLVATGPATGLGLRDAIHPIHLALAGLRKSPPLLERIGEQQVLESRVFRVNDREPPLSVPLQLSRKERSVLGLVDGKRTVLEIRAVAHLAQARIEESLALLVGTGLIVAADGRCDEEVSGASIQMQAIGSSGTYRTGNLAAQPFVELLGLLARERATGMLRLDGPTSRTLVFTDGQLSFARSSAHEDRIGSVLLAHGMVKPAALTAALEAQRQRPDQRLGTILHDQGALTLAALERALKLQFWQITEATLPCSDGSYVFTPSAGASLRLHLDLAWYDLLRLGAAMVAPDYLRARWCGGPAEQRLAATTLEPAGALSDGELAVWVDAADHVAIEHLVAENPEVLPTIQFLVAAGLIEVQSRTRTRAHAIELATTEPEIPVLVLDADLVLAAPANVPVPGNLVERIQTMLREEFRAERVVARANAENDLARRHGELAVLEQQNRALAAENWALRSEVETLRASRPTPGRVAVKRATTTKPKPKARAARGAAPALSPPGSTPEVTASAPPSPPADAPRIPATKSAAKRTRRAPQEAAREVVPSPRALARSAEQGAEPGSAPRSPLG